MGGKATGGRRCLLAEALEIESALKREFEGLYERWEVAGSVRRGKPEVGDVDIVVIPKDGVLFADDFNKRVGDMFGWQVTKKKGEFPKPKKSGLVEGVQVDFFVTTVEGWGAMLAFATGSAVTNIKQRQKAKTLGLLLNEKGVWRDGVRIAGATEEDVYEALELDFIKPSER